MKLEHTVEATCLMAIIQMKPIQMKLSGLRQYPFCSSSLMLKQRIESNPKVKPKTAGDTLSQATGHNNINNLNTEQTDTTMHHCSSNN